MAGLRPDQATRRREGAVRLDHFLGRFQGHGPPHLAEEEEGAPRALPYPVIEAILGAMPDVTRAIKGGAVEAGPLAAHTAAPRACRLGSASMRKSLGRACSTVEKAFQQDGVDIDLSRVRPYDFRHSYATAVLAATQDLKTTQRLMLHSSSSTTERYARAAVDPVLVAALDLFSAHVRETK